MSNAIENANIYLVFSRNLANAILFCTGQRYQKHDKDGGGTVYTFVNSPELRECIDKLKELQNEYLTQS